MTNIVQRFQGAKAEYVDNNRYESLRDLILSNEEATMIAELDPETIPYLLRVKKLPFEALDDFARRGDERVMGAIAAKYPLLPETYDFLASQGENVRVSLSSNKKLPAHLIERFRHDESPLVREIVNAKHPAFGHE